MCTMVYQLGALGVPGRGIHAVPWQPTCANMLALTTGCVCEIGVSVGLCTRVSWGVCVHVWEAMHVA